MSEEWTFEELVVSLRDRAGQRASAAIFSNPALKAEDTREWKAADLLLEQSRQIASLLAQVKAWEDKAGEVPVVPDLSITCCCSLVERDSGHRVDCTVPQIHDYIDALSAALVVARKENEGLKASSRCPMCGKDTPHSHSIREVIEYLKLQALQFLNPGEKDAIIISETACVEPSGWRFMPLEITDEMVKAAHQTRLMQTDSMKQQIQRQHTAMIRVAPRPCLPAAEAESAGMREALREVSDWATHNINCPVTYTQGTHNPKCDCGYSDLIPRIDALLAPRTEQKAAPQVAHGLCRADDPNEEGSHEPGRSDDGHKPAAPPAVDARREGLPVSVSDDRAGTSIPVGAAPYDINKDI